MRRDKEWHEMDSFVEKYEVYVKEFIINVS